VLALRRGGTLVWLGISGDLERGWRGMLANAATFAGLKLRPDGKRVRLYLITFTAGGWRRCRDDWAELLAMHARGELAPVVGARVPLAEVRRAHEVIDGAKVPGKIVLTP
jgi:NADPH:quinone reductase